MDQDRVDRLALEAAYQMALKSRDEGGIPIGSALAAPDGQIISAGHNLRVQEGDTTAHAETACIRAAGRRRDWHTLTLASTLSPCAMCAGAAILHRIRRVVIGASVARELPTRRFVAPVGLFRRAGRGGRRRRGGRPDSLALRSR